MKTRYLFSLAALALLTAACSSDEMAQTPAPAEQPAPAKQMIPFSAVIGSNAATTRVLAEAENGETITAKWQKGEKIALIHGEAIDTLEVSYVDATTGAATITGDITSPTNNEAVNVVYVGHQLGCMGEFVNGLKASMADHPDQTEIPEEVITEMIKERLNIQDGTLETISNKLDCRYTTSTLKVSDGTATFGSKVELNPCFTIWKVNLINERNQPFDTQKLEFDIFHSDNSYTPYFLDNGNMRSTFYVAFIPDGTSYEFSTDIDNAIYKYTIHDITLEIGKFYTSTLQLEEWRDSE